MKVGRPTIYTKELADKICEMIVDGRSLRTVSKELNFPLSCFFTWIRTYEEFSKQYARAKEEQAETFTEDMLFIADEVIERDVHGKIDTGAINRNRLRVDTRKWIASKLKPKKYGDATTLRGDSDAPLAVPTFNLTLNKSSD